MNEEVINAITSEIDNAFSSEKAIDIGMLTIKSANQTVVDAARRPDPRELYHELWYEGEVCCLFADSNLGKSIFAVQMADEIARSQNVLYVDCELSDKQFQLRYLDSESNTKHLFPEGLYRAEVNPCRLGTYSMFIRGEFADEIPRCYRCTCGIRKNSNHLCRTNSEIHLGGDW